MKSVKFVFSLFVFFLFIFSTSFGQPIFDATRLGNIKKVKKIIKKNPELVNVKNADGYSPLIIATYRDQLKIAEFLLKNKADVNMTSDEGPAIMGVCYKGNMAMANLLFSYNANANVQNDNGTTPLMYAVMGKNIELVKLLLSKGAKKETLELSGKSALDYAKLSEDLILIDLLK